MFKKFVTLVYLGVMVVSVWLTNKRQKEHNAILAGCSDPVALEQYEREIEQKLSGRKKKIF